MDGNTGLWFQPSPVGGIFGFFGWISAILAGLFIFLLGLIFQFVYYAIYLPEQPITYGGLASILLTSLFAGIVTAVLAKLFSRPSNPRQRTRRIVVE